ncbi:MAG: GntR family transcriptional regulator [Bacilli bacterium]
MKTPLYSHVADDLRQQIRTGELLDRIPPETTLASNFQVSVPTVKKALGILETEDVIVRIQGKGTFVRPEARQGLQVSGNVKEGEQHGENSEEQPKGQSVVEALRRTGDKPTMVGVILPMAQDGFPRRLLSGILEGLSEHGVHGVVDFSGSERERESEIVASFLRAGVDGLIVFPVDGEIYNKDLVLLSIERFPLVFVDRWFPGIDASRVVSQHANGVKEAVNALYALGHRSMALVSVAVNFPTSTESVVERTKGFLEGLKGNGIIPMDETLWVREVKEDAAFHDAQAHEYLVNKLRQHPEVTALVGISSTDVQIALKVARLAGRNVPDDLSIVGFDIGAECSDVGSLFGESAEDFPVGWIDQSEVAIGKEAAGLMSRLIAGSGKTEVIEVPATFRWGRTCAAAPTSPERSFQMMAAVDEVKR